MDYPITKHVEIELEGVPKPLKLLMPQDDVERLQSLLINGVRWDDDGDVRFFEGETYSLEFMVSLVHIQSVTIVDYQLDMVSPQEYLNKEYEDTPELISIYYIGDTEPRLYGFDDDPRSAADISFLMSMVTQKDILNSFYFMNNDGDLHIINMPNILFISVHKGIIDGAKPHGVGDGVDD